jgi:DNA primase
VIIDRAKAILHKWNIESMPSVDEVYKQISNTLKLGKVEKYGPEELPAGPELESSKEIIVVEGRADIINLMRCGILNTVALEGAKIPESIKKLTKEKEATALLDGDRGGDLILKELMQVTSIRYVGRAPRGKEIEECNCNEIADALDSRVPVNTINKPKRERPKIEIPDEITQAAKMLQGTLEAILLNEKLKQTERLPVSQLAEKLQQATDIDTVIFDGIITQRIVDVAGEKNIKRIVASRISEAVKPALNVELITFQDAIPS